MRTRPAKAKSGMRKKYEKRLRHAKKSGMSASAMPISGLVRRERHAITRQISIASPSSARYAVEDSSGSPPFVPRNTRPAPRGNIGSINGGGTPAIQSRRGQAMNGRVLTGEEGAT